MKISLFKCQLFHTLGRILAFLFLRFMGKQCKQITKVVVTKYNKTSWPSKHNDKLFFFFYMVWVCLDKKKKKKADGRRRTACAKKKDTYKANSNRETHLHVELLGRRAIHWHNLIYNSSSKKFENISLHGIGPVVKVHEKKYLEKTKVHGAMCSRRFFLFFFFFFFFFFTGEE